MKHYNQTEGATMETKYAPPYVCLVVGYFLKEEIKLFPIELSELFQLKKLKLLNKYSEDIWTMHFYYYQPW